MALHFELVTPERLIRSEDVHMVVVPGTEGEFGVLEGHAPVMSTIRDGAVQVYRTDGAAPESIAVQGGFAEVGETGLTVLAEHVASDVDVRVTARTPEMSARPPERSRPPQGGL
jgi:F-type H+-transporting ATPase subunit epsilon